MQVSLPLPLHNESASNPSAKPIVGGGEAVVAVQVHSRFLYAALIPGVTTGDMFIERNNDHVLRPADKVRALVFLRQDPDIAVPVGWLRSRKSASLCSLWLCGLKRHGLSSRQDVM